MKKLLKLSAVMLLTCMSVAGCSSTPAEEDTNQEPEQQETNNQTAETTWEDELGQNGVIAIGISPDYPPYESINTEGEMEGFDIDMITELQKYLGSEESPYEIEWVQMSFDTIVSAVQTGQVDLGVAGFTYDPDRDVLFSDAYMESAQVVLVNQNSDIKSTADLNDKLIGVQMGSTGEKAAQEIEGAQLQSVNSVNILAESLKNDALDAIVVDIAVAKNYVENAGFTMLEEPLIDESTSIIAAKSNTKLMDKINEAIASFKASDAYNELVEKWGMK